MKRMMILVFLFIGLFGYVTAGSVGISPAYYVEHFQPNLEKTFSFRAFNPGLDGGVSVSLEGDLAPYANLSKNFVKGSGSFRVSLKLPQNLSKPGTHNVFIVIKESKNESQGIIGGIASIRVPIRVIVPYPGQYVGSSLKVDNINKGESAKYELNIQNLGTDDTKMNVLIEVFRVNENGERVLYNNVNDIPLKSTKSISVSGSLDTSNLEAGDYYAKATITYSNKTDITSDNFRIGKFLVNITDYDYRFERGRINQFDITVENEWNTKIDSIYADVTITDEGKVVSTFRTVSVDTNPWEVKQMTGFFDATEMEVGKYLANMNVYYGNSSTHKLAAIYIENPPKERGYLIYALIAIGVLSLAMLAGFAILIIKLKKLKGQIANGKKRK